MKGAGDGKASAKTKALNYVVTTVTIVATKNKTMSNNSLSIEQLVDSSKEKFIQK